MKLNLSATEGRKMVKAMCDLAIERGWEPDELEECGVIAEYGAVIDAAMKAIGLEIEIDPNEEDEDEDEEYADEDYYEDEYFEDEDDEDEESEESEEVDTNTTKYCLTVKGQFALAYMEAGHTFEEACEIADLLFGKGEGE